MRAYDVATTAITLKVPAKWLDNVLSHHRVPGVISRRQGVARRLTPEAVTVLEIALILIRTLGLARPRALEIANLILREGDRGTPWTAGGLTLTIDVQAVRSDLDRRLAGAVESAPLPRRGRPRRRT